MKKRYIVGGVLVGLLVIGMIAGGDETATSGTATSSATAIAAAVDVTATDISKAYQENEARAQLAYEGKVLRVSGKVKDIDLSIGDSPIIKLKGAGDQYDMGVNQDGKMTDVNISGLSKQDAAAITKGETMSFVCTEVSEVMGSAQLQNCSVSNPEPKKPA